MLLSRAAVLALPSACVFARQNERDHGDGMTFLEGEITVHLVTVGQHDQEFYPSSTTAKVGDKVMFKFWPGNHSVIESLYRWPCIPRFAVDGKPGYASRSYPVPNPNNPAVLNYTVLNIDPFFYHCGAPGSCVSQGMLGAINPREDQNVKAQKELATKAGIVLTTTETLSPDKASSMSAVAATVMPEEHEDEHEHGHEDEHKRKLSAGAIAGIVIGGVIGLALVGASVFALDRQRAHKKTLKDNPNEPARQAHTTAAPAPEMQIDGITYVPATDYKAMYGPQPPPSYHHLSPDVRPNSPESTFSSPHGAPTTLYSPSIGSIRNRYSDVGPDMTAHPQPQPVMQLPLLHELDVQPPYESRDISRRGTTSS